MTRHVGPILLVLLALNTLWFVAYSGALGIEGLTRDLAGENRLWDPAAPVATAVLFGHMVSGAILTLAAPLQALPVLRRRWPGLHRRAGYWIGALAMVTGIGGLVYIVARGTIGGPWMSAGFALYGVLLMLAAVNTIYHAIAKDLRRHGRWAARLVVLAVGSWIYRMHYGLWYLATDGMASDDAFTGRFDRVQVFAFFLPYLLILECVFLWRDRRRARRGGAAIRTREA